jgi:hypothetical protein
MQDFKLNVAYVDPTDTPFVGKKIFETTGTPSLTPVLGNLNVTVNQTQAQYNATPFPAWFCGLTRNFKLRWADATYFMDANRHVLTLAANRIYLGVGNTATPTNVALINLPAITADLSARSIAVRFKGMLTALNTNAANQDDLTNCLFDTSRGAYSLKDGAIVVSAGTSDDLMNAVAVTAVSSDSGAYLFTGINMGLTYSAPARTIQIDALPLGSGTNLGGVLAFIHSGEIELLTVGKLQELIYLQ